MAGPTTAAEVRANVPEAAKKHTPDGAGAFVRYYIEMINSASFRRQKGLMNGLADPKCVACRAVDADIDDLLKGGERYQDPPLKIVEVYPRYVGNEVQQFVNVIVDDVKNQVVDSGGNTVQRIKGGRSDYLFDVQWRSGEWVTLEFQADPIEKKR